MQLSDCHIHCAQAWRIIKDLVISTCPTTRHRVDFFCSDLLIKKQFSFYLDDLSDNPHVQVHAEGQGD